MTELIYALAGAGVLMILAEVLVPGGVVGAIGALLLATGVVLAFTEGPGFGFALLTGSVLFGLGFFWLWVKYFPRSSMGKKVFLSQDAHEWHSYSDDTGELIGKRGTAHTPLRPSGTAIIGGKRTDVVTRGEMVGTEAPVEVIAVHGNRIVVQETEPEPQEGDNAAGPSTASATPSTPNQPA